MEAVRLFEIVTENGLNINSPELKKYVNRQVEIIVFPVENADIKKQKLMELAGMFDEDDIKAFEVALEECRKIDYEGWDEKIFD